MKKEMNIFEKMKTGAEVRKEDPQYGEFMDAVGRTLKLNVALNSSDNVNTTRERLSEIIGSTIHESTAIFTPFHTNFGRHTIIGRNVFINHACSFLDLGGITIEDDVLIGPKVNLITENHPIDPTNRKTLLCAPILIKKNAWIGAAATILPGVVIGENAVVAAGAVVTKNVPDNTIVAGVPAKVVKEIP